MKNSTDNRVLGRRGARIVTEDETTVVSAAALATKTKCSFVPSSGADGDQFTGDCFAN
jgi:hypothetical protein